MEMDVEGVSPRSEPIPRSQGAGGACPAPPPPPQPQPRPRPRPQHQPQPPPPQQLAQDDPPGESAGAEDSDDPEARPHSEKGESKVTDSPVSSLQDLKGPQPLAAPHVTAMFPERRREAGPEEALLLGQRMDHLLRRPGELPQDAEEDLLVPRTETRQLNPRSTSRGTPPGWSTLSRGSGLDCFCFAFTCVCNTQLWRLLNGWLLSFFPPVFSFSSLGPGNCKKRIALEHIILLLKFSL